MTCKPNLFTGPGLFDIPKKPVNRFASCPWSSSGRVPRARSEPIYWFLGDPTPDIVTRFVGFVPLVIQRTRGERERERGRFSLGLPALREPLGG